MLHRYILGKTRKRIVYAFVAMLLISGLTFAPHSVTYACGTMGGGVCPCPGC